MAVYTPVAAEALAAFLDDYAVGSLVSAKGIAEGVENTNYLVDTTKARFILTLYEKRVAADDLPFFVALLDHLAARGLPVPPAVRDKSGAAIKQLAGRPACLMEFLPGVSVTRPTPAQALAAGAMLARLHQAVDDFPLRRGNSMGVASWRPLFERCGAQLDTIAVGLQADIASVLDELEREWPDALPRSVIHADLFPDNVLMLGDTVTGLIDFYFASHDLRLFDLAIMHAAWAFDTDGRVGDRAVGEALLEGYRELYPPTAQDLAAFGLLATGACLRFTLSRAWDWMHTPPDALVTRKDPLAFWRRIPAYAPHLAVRCPTLA